MNSCLCSISSRSECGFSFELGFELSIFDWIKFVIQVRAFWIIWAGCWTFLRDVRSVFVEFNVVKSFFESDWRSKLLKIFYLRLQLDKRVKNYSFRLRFSYLSGKFLPANSPYKFSFTKVLSFSILKQLRFP